jgi:hypothetical protein
MLSLCMWAFSAGNGLHVVGAVLLLLQMLVAAIHSCAVKFPEVASSVVHLLMDFLGDPMVRGGFTCLLLSTAPL